MAFVGVDLGSTNLKVALYNDQFQLISEESLPVSYKKDEHYIEFDVEEYFQKLLKLLSDLPKDVKITHMGFTGQAESLVILDKEGTPLSNAISWMDERSKEECNMIMQRFNKEEYEAVTGQLSVLPTWPATKILWLRRNRKEIFDQTANYMLLKDYIIYRFTGKKLADKSIATFSFYFDIYKQCYWSEMLDFIGISQEQLPTLVEPCTSAGKILPEVASQIGFDKSVKINLGTLDHFAGMIGTGNIKPGGISLSTGTVMGLSIFSEKAEPCGIAMHYGFIPNTYVMLPVIESGGASLEWYRSNFMKELSYAELDKEVEKRNPQENIIFLPFVIGSNAPRFDENASGMFSGLRGNHDDFDLALAVMKGVAFILRENCDVLSNAKVEVDYIIATGGGARSKFWSQLYADITGIPILLPENQETACLGAAIAAAVEGGFYDSYESASNKVVKIVKEYKPRKNTMYEKQYKQYRYLYDAMIESSKICL